MMRLVEQGKVELTAPLRRYLPAFRVKDADASARATVQDTLTHMGECEGDFFADPSNGDDALERQVEGMIEIITKQPFEAAFKDIVLKPFGLETAYFFPADVMTAGS
jgi:CubicO group peptidase (beta-lactamase class C family)